MMFGFVIGLAPRICIQGEMQILGARPMMTARHTPHTFVVLYSGRTIAEAKVIAASSAPDLVEAAAKVMLGDLDSNPETQTDPALAGRRRALRLVTSKAQ